MCVCFCVRTFVTSILYLHESPDLVKHGCAMCIHTVLVHDWMYCIFKYITCLHTVQKIYVYIQKMLYDCRKYVFPLEECLICDPIGELFKKIGWCWRRGKKSLKLCVFLSVYIHFVCVYIHLHVSVQVTAFANLKSKTTPTWDRIYLCPETE